jgi:hypothetical protein
VIFKEQKLYEVNFFGDYKTGILGCQRKAMSIKIWMTLLFVDESG